jgi:response regulator of citrate/malate metabolism
MTVNKGAAGNTIDALCSIIRKRSTKKSNDFLGKNFQSEKLTNKKKYLKMGITKKH